MSSKDLVREILFALKANKLRSALTIFGIVCGIAAVTCLSAMIAGFGNSILGDITSLREHSLEVSQYKPEIFSRDRLSLVEEKLSNVEIFAPLYTHTSQVKTKRSSTTTTFVCNTKNALQKAYMFKLEQGRWFTNNEAQSASNNVIVTPSILQELYGNKHEPIEGKSINIEGSIYNIIGVISKNIGGDIILTEPSFKAHFYVGTPSKVCLIYNSSTNMDKAYTEAQDAFNAVAPLSKAKGQASFGITSLKNSKQIVKQISAVFSLIFSLVAGVSLFVGGIGIMNMMLTNVSERMREIGLRKAVGARSRDINRQFLGESVVLCLAGGIIGILFGYGFAWLIALIINLTQDQVQLMPILSVEVLGIALTVSVVTGIIFGYYPARRAAKLNPVEALRAQ